MAIPGTSMSLYYLMAIFKLQSVELSEYLKHFFQYRSNQILSRQITLDAWLCAVHCIIAVT